MKRIGNFRTSWFLITVAVLLGCGPKSKPESDKPKDMLQGIVTAKPADTPETLAAKEVQIGKNLQTAKESAAKGELDNAIALLEETVGLNDKQREVLLLLIQYSQQRSKEVAIEDPAKSYRLIVQAGGYLRTVQEAFKDLTDSEKTMMANVLFDEACSHAHSKRQDEFRGSLGAALSAGFADAARLENDPDIKALRSDPGINQLVAEAIKKLQ